MAGIQIIQRDMLYVLTGLVRLLIWKGKTETTFLSVPSYVTLLFLPVRRGGPEALEPEAVCKMPWGLVLR